MNCVHLQFLVGDDSGKEEGNQLENKKATEVKENKFNVSAKLLEEKEFVINELTFEIKKLRAELNNAVSEINNLKKITSDLSDPYKTFNKEILLNNGSTIQGKILYQDDESLKVATIIGTLTVDRNTIIRVVEKSPLAPTSIEEAVAHSQEASMGLMNSENGFISNLGIQADNSKPIMNSANLVLIGNIDEVKDNSGNTILSGDIKNIGIQRADFAKVTFTIKKNWNGDTKTMTAFAQGTYHTFESGITANSSVLAGASASFELIIPSSFGPFIGYSYNIEWDEYQ
tara:strand:+ start:992 stop:1849 length:858 start_codon:yes stop_codon:yes gene_type:complete